MKSKYDETHTASDFNAEQIMIMVEIIPDDGGQSFLSSDICLIDLFTLSSFWQSVRRFICLFAYQVIQLSTY